MRQLDRIVNLYRDAFGGLPRRTWLLCVAGFLNRCGSMVVPFLSLYLGKRFGFSVAEAGPIISAYGLGAVLGSLIGGRLADVLGPVVVQVVTLGATALWMLVMPWLHDPYVFAASVFVLGALYDAFRPGSITAVAVSCEPALRRKALSLNRLMMNAGWAFGPTIGGFLVRIDYTLMFYADAATCALAATFLWFLSRSWSPERVLRAEGETRAGRPFRDRHFLLLMSCNLLVLVAFMQYFTTGPRHFEEALGLDERTIGFLLAINPILITLFEMPIVHSLRARPALPIVALGSLVVGLGYLLLLPPLGATGVAMAMAVVAGGELLQMPVLGAYVNDHAPPHARGAYNGAYGMFFCLALVLAPWLGGLVYEGAGDSALWLACAAAGLLAALGFWRLGRST